MDTNTKLIEPYNTKYDTTINVIGSLKDTNVINKAITAYFNESDSFNDLIANRNEFNLRTDKSRSRIETAVNQTFLRFVNDDHETLIKQIFYYDASVADRNIVLFWQLALNNRLFRELSTDVYMKVYLSGRTTLVKDDIIGYVKEMLAQPANCAIKWSESTIDIIATKYLSFMTKLNFMEGARTKSFRIISPSLAAQTLFIYFALLFNPNNEDVLQNKFLPLSFIDCSEIVERLKKLSLKGYLNMSYNGVNLYVQTKYDYKGICHVLYG